MNLIMTATNNLVEMTVGNHGPGAFPWKWEIPVYLFLGGLVAGILILSSIFYLLKKDEDMPFTIFRAPMWAMPLLGLGMFALFLDLSHKLYVWRFYTAFVPSSPMSWGSWVLLLAFPTSLLFGLIQLKGEDRAWLKGKVLSIPLLSKISFITNLLEKVIDFAFNLADKLKKYTKKLAITNLVIGIFLGIYTGILLSAFVARPFWNTSILGLLFLTSGLSAASAFGLLFAKKDTEKKTLIKLDLGFLIFEVLILILIIIGWFGSNAYTKEAGLLVFGGQYTVAFWSLVVGFGMIMPIVLEIAELREKLHFKYVAPVIVLVGGLFLRVFMVYIGQTSHIGM